MDLPHQHSRRAIQEKFNKAREDFLKTELESENQRLKQGHDDEKNDLKAEIELLKEEIAILKTAKEKAELDLIVEQ
ncbi:hypothetical protein A2U01_0074075, partial [Trifolium medium]|nr:hypothetical protein [Trifolium medium]